MKVTVNIDCTPAEARAFLGLPDIAPLQQHMMAELQDRMTDSLRNLDPESFMKTWLPATIQSWGDLQKSFWSQMGAGGLNPMNPMNPMNPAHPAKESDTRDSGDTKPTGKKTSD